MKHGKKYNEAAKKFNAQSLQTVEKAVEIMKQCTFAKFDETVELAMKLNIKAQQSIRDTVVLPHLLQLYII